MPNFAQELTFTGLGTLSVIVPVADLYFFKGKMTIPELSTGSSAPSQLVVTINKNGSPVYTGQAGAEGFYVTLQLAALDLIAIVFSSAAAVDQPINVIKAVIAYGSGQ